MGSQDIAVDVTRSILANHFDYRSHRRLRIYELPNASQTRANQWVRSILSPGH